MYTAASLLALRRTRCSLTTQDAAADKFRYIMWGSLDEPEKIPPKGEFFCKSRPEWMPEIQGMVPGSDTPGRDDPRPQQAGALMFQQVCFTNGKSKNEEGRLKCDQIMAFHERTMGKSDWGQLSSRRWDSVRFLHPFNGQPPSNKDAYCKSMKCSALGQNVLKGAK